MRANSAPARLGAGLILCLLAGGVLAETPGQGPEPAWRPELTEQLVRLPAAALTRKIESDLGESSLGQALREQEQKLQRQLATLGDLHAALKLAAGEQRTTLAHNLVVEKEAFIAIATERNRLARRQLETRKGVLSSLLSRLGMEGASLDDGARVLREQQEAARRRLEASLARADQILGTGPGDRDSRYARDYEQKRAALDALRRRLAGHPLNRDPVIGGSPVTKAEYVRHLIVAAEGETALLDLEEEMLGYMAKLVSLDALALAEELEDPELADSGRAEPVGIDGAAPFFVN